MLVIYDGNFHPLAVIFAYYITFPNKGYTNNIFVNDSTNAFPLIYTAVGAGLVMMLVVHVLYCNHPRLSVGRSHRAGEQQWK